MDAKQNVLEYKDRNHVYLYHNEKEEDKEMDGPLHKMRSGNLVSNSSLSHGHKSFGGMSDFNQWINLTQDLDVANPNFISGTIKHLALWIFNVPTSTSLAMTEISISYLYISVWITLYNIALSLSLFSIAFGSGSWLDKTKQ